jgi:hypothetical protein
MSVSISGAGSTSAVSELAALLVEIDSNQADMSRLSRETARDSYLEHAQDQVDAMYSAADATMAGALVGGAFAVAGGAVAIGGACVQYDADVNSAARETLIKGTPEFSADKCTYGLVIADQSQAAKIYSAAGSTLEHLAGPANSFAEGTAQRFKAEAKHDEVLAEQAKWQASDANTSIDKADKQTDKFLDLLQGIQRDQNSSTNSIIGRI